uniref:Zona pellucida glycoprotein 3f, tandem duplicate 1 n=1 Tax=Sphaeramia orbicularis TaxID=375764 RepID=A0A673AGK6_9TELE
IFCSVSSVFSVMMAFFVLRALLFTLTAAFSVHADMKLDCQRDFISLVWTDRRYQVDTSLFRLGNCFPTSLSATEAVFKVQLNDCNSVRLCTVIISPTSLLLILTYKASPSRWFTWTVLILFYFSRPKDWYRQMYDPVFNTHGLGELVFHIGLMNEDFSGPAESTAFPLGSIIPIMASVEQRSHQPLLLLLEECDATNTPELSPESSVHTIITNKGCFVDGKISRSKFEPRQKSSEIQMSLQAFRFAQGEEVFLHCKLVAWDLNGLDNTKKACNYNKEQGWELLDNPAFSHLCYCCDSSCLSRKTRSAVPDEHRIAHKAVLGPLTITDENS